MKGDNMRNARENFILSGVVCIMFGAFFSVAGIFALAGTVGISGVVLFIIGMSTKSEMGLSKKEIREWLPASEGMPEAGRVMYRVDTRFGNGFQRVKECLRLDELCIVLILQ